MTNNVTNFNIRMQNIAIVYPETPDCNTQTDLDELQGLASTANAKIAFTFLQKRNVIDPVTVVGQGKLDEIKNAIGMFDGTDNEIDLVLFGTPLNATQRNAIEKKLDKPVIDRIDLILDIFAIRATTTEGKTQVELAQLTYNLANHPTDTKLSRQGAGIGTRGPGETKLETNKRAIRERMYKLRTRLKEIAARRNLTRKNRVENKAFVVALVGYTNAGKSTLFNALTNQAVYADDKLFATLDTTVRSGEIDGLSLLYIDTVGFINNLPHQLVDAFKSTLEETTYADLVLHVLDVSDENLDMHAHVTEQILTELHVTAPVLRVYNKCDKPHPYFANDTDNAVFVSAKNGDGLDNLRDIIRLQMSSAYAKLTLQIPFEKSGEVLSQLGAINATYEPCECVDCIKLAVTLKRQYVDKFLQYVVI